ncbi:MAG: hypothetical protein PHT02_00815 [Tissierellia bacterium]|nr:hypothetical protein [Tissierellia bacterium]
MDKQDNNIDYKGMALALSFLIVAVFLYCFPNYLKYEISSKVVAIILSVIGIMGLGFELNRINNKTKGMDDVGLGLAFFVVWGILYYYFPLWYINIFTLPLLLGASFGITLGLLRINIILFENKDKVITNVFIIIIQLVAVVSSILQILQILKFI